MEETGFYGSNNGTLAFVNEQGLKFVGPWTEEREKELRDAGYGDRGMGVYIPLSNGEIIQNPEVKEYWKNLQEKERITSKREYTGRGLEEFAKAFKANQEKAKYDKKY